VTYRSLQKDVGGTIVTDELDERPDSSPTFVVRSESGGSLASGTGSVDSVSTTLSAGASSGVLTISVTSATGITAGRRYLLTGAESAGGEWVTVRAISGTTLALARPLALSHSSGASVVSTRISCAVSAAACADVRRGCRVEITYTVSAATRPIVSVEFDITRYRLTTGLTLEHVRDLDPQLLKRAAPGTWWPSLIATAWERIVSRIGQQHAPGGLVGAIDLTQPHAIAVRLLVAEQGTSEESRAHATELRTRFDAELQLLLSSRAFDDDQDGGVDPNEGFLKTINVIRG
jgi:hypothetical protein